MARKEAREIYCCRIDEDELNVFLASTEKGGIRIGLALGTDASPVDFFAGAFPDARRTEDFERNATLARAVKDSLAGRPALKEPRSFDISPSDFQRKVLEGLSRIPFGVLLSYGQVAAMIGRPGSARAVGQALGANPLPLIFP